MKKNEKGFGLVEIVMTIVIISLIVAVGWLVHDRQKDKNNSQTTAAATTKTQGSSAASAPETVGTVVTTKDGHGSFILPEEWKVKDRIDGGQYCGYATTDNAGTCLLDVTYQPNDAIDGPTDWYTKFFKTNKSLQAWNNEVNGGVLGRTCATAPDINGYKVFKCDDSGTEYLVSNGTYLAVFKASIDKRASDFKSIVNSIKFN